MHFSSGMPLPAAYNAIEYRDWVSKRLRHTKYIVFRFLGPEEGPDGLGISITLDIRAPASLPSNDVEAVKRIVSQADAKARRSCEHVNNHGAENLYGIPTAKKL